MSGKEGDGVQAHGGLAVGSCLWFGGGDGSEEARVISHPKAWHVSPCPELCRGSTCRHFIALQRRGSLEILFGSPQAAGLRDS